MIQKDEGAALLWTQKTGEYRAAQLDHIKPLVASEKLLWRLKEFTGS